MLNQPRSILLALFALVTAVGCDAEDETLLDDTELRFVSMPNNFVFLPYHGHWEGLMDQVDGITQNDYIATLEFAPGMCLNSGGAISRAKWDYFNVGETCTSVLELMNVTVAPDGTRTWTFYDSNVSGPCMDGRVELTETDDPDVMWHTWSNLNGILDAEGFVTQDGICGSGSQGNL